MYNFNIYIYIIFNMSNATNFNHNEIISTISTISTTNSEQNDTITTSDIYNENITIITKTYTHNDKKILVKRIGDIKNRKCYIKIFKIIHGDNFKYTKNDNGIFFNLTSLTDNTLAKIESIIQFFENKKSQNEQQLIKNLNN
jgi:hypothetical protein